jgi:hypothetical protein
VEKNIGRHGTSAVKAPVLDGPRPIAAVSHRLASVQFSESMPWLNQKGGSKTSIGCVSKHQAQQSRLSGRARPLLRIEKKKGERRG